MPKIWRVEDNSGFGCYESHLPELEWMYLKHAKNRARNPIPLDDKSILRQQKEFEICGFINKSQALKWFDSYELKRLKQFGFELKAVEVAEITAIGRNQVLAIRFVDEAEYRMSFNLPG